MDKKVIVTEVSTGARKHTLTGSAASILCLDISEDEKSLMAGSADNAIKIWSIESGRTNVSLFGGASN